MSFQPTSGQGSTAVTATVSNVVANYGSGSTTSASPGTNATIEASQTYMAASLNILNVGTTPPVAKN